MGSTSNPTPLIKVNSEHDLLYWGRMLDPNMKQVHLCTNLKWVATILTDKVKATSLNLNTQSYTFPSIPTAMKVRRGV